jgi:acyl dehydratase
MEATAAHPSHALEQARTLLGPQLNRSRQTWNTEVTKDAIRHFCWGMGDDNPLYVDDEYARASVLGAFSAPGTYLFTIDSSIVFPGLPSTPILHVGTEWTWHERAWAGDAIRADVEYDDCRKVRGRSGGALIIPLTKNTIVDRLTLDLELEHIREVGYAVSRGERVDGASGLSVAILDADGQATMAALSILGPSARMDEETMTGFLTPLRKFADEISARVLQHERVRTSRQATGTTRPGQPSETGGDPHAE